MQRSIEATTEIFAIMDSEPTVQDAPDAISEFRHREGDRVRSRHLPLRQRCDRCRHRPESADRARENLRARRRERRGQKHHSLAYPAAL